MNAEAPLLYAIGRVKSLESKLLSHEKLARIAEAESLETAFNLLSDTPYGQHISRLGAEASIESMFEFELNILKAFFDLLAPTNPLIRKLWEKYDIYNLKILIRSNAFKAREEKLFTCGNIEPARLKYFIFEGVDNIPKHIKDLANKAKTFSTDPRAVECFIDREYFSGLYQLSKSAKVPLFSVYTKAQIDLINLKTYLRLRPDNRFNFLFDQAFLPHGKLSRSIFKLPYSEIKNKLKFSDYGLSLASALQEHQDNTALTEIEKAVDNHLLNIIKKAKYLCFGIEPLIGFFIAKEYEMRNLKLVLLSKEHKIDAPLIKERLLASYV